MDEHAQNRKGIRGWVGVFFFAINPKTGELLVTDSVRNMALVYRIKDILQSLELKEG